MPSLWDISRCCCTPPDTSCNGCSRCCCASMNLNPNLKVVFDIPCVSTESKQGMLVAAQSAVGECMRWTLLFPGFPYFLALRPQCCVPMPPRLVNGVNDVILACKVPIDQTGNPCVQVPGCTSSCHDYELKVRWCEPTNPYVIATQQTCQCSPLLLQYSIAVPAQTATCGCAGWGTTMSVTITQA